MLKIRTSDVEAFDQQTNEFIHIKPQNLVLEHSLVSISKWESKWHKPYLNTSKTSEEVIDYIRCMTLTQNVDPLVYRCISSEEMEKIAKYIDDPMTATWFSEDQKKQHPIGNEVITSEIIYYWMICFNIPVEFQKWHINRLITLIRVCSEKNKPPKKMSQRELMARNTKLNAARRKKYNSRG